MFTMDVKQQHKTPFLKYSEGQKFCMVQFCIAIIKTFHCTHDKNLDIETEKSEQTVFAQISSSQY